MTTTNQHPNRPFAKCKLGAIAVTIWKNEGENSSYFTLNISRSYRDAKTGDYHDTMSFRPEDIPMVICQLERALEHITDHLTE